MWDSSFDRLPNTGQVDVDHVGPVGLTGAVERLPTVADSRVGADDVQPSQLLDAAVDGGLDRFVVANVDLGGDDAAVQLLDQICGFSQVVWSGRLDLGVAAHRGTDVDGDDVGTLLGQTYRVATSLPACGSGDEG